MCRSYGKANALQILIERLSVNKNRRFVPLTNVFGSNRLYFNYLILLLSAARSLMITSLQLPGHNKSYLPYSTLLMARMLLYLASEIIMPFLSLSACIICPSPMYSATCPL